MSGEDSSEPTSLSGPASTEGPSKSTVRLAEGPVAESGFDGFENAQRVPAFETASPPPPVVVFECECPYTRVGESVYVVGNTQELGEWSLERGTGLITSAKEFPLWRSCVFKLVHHPPNDPVEFKFFIGTPPANQGMPTNVRWEDCSNRKFRVPEPGQLASIRSKFGSDPNVHVSISTSAAANVLPGLIPAANSATSSSLSSPLLPDSVTTASPIPSSIPSPSPPITMQPQPIYPPLKPCQDLQSITQPLLQKFQNGASLRQKLIAIRESLETACHDSTPNYVIIIVQCSLLCYGLHAGFIKCREDGGHHRPNQTSEASLGIIRACESAIENVAAEDSWEADIARYYSRRIQQYLTSVDDRFMTSVPLTRIRDLAHRNDISQPLKTEIKTRLQNKLHRCAGPEDLLTAMEFFERFNRSQPSVPPSFYHEYKVFLEELKDFFNANELTDRLKRLHSVPLDSKRSVSSQRSAAINLFIANKEAMGKNTAPRERALHIHKVVQAATILRHTFISEFTGVEADLIQASFQQMRICEIEAEIYTFAQVAEFANILEKQATETGDLAKDLQLCVLAVEVLANCLRHLALSGLMRKQAAQLINEIEMSLSSPLEPASNEFGGRRLQWLHVVSVLQRIMILTSLCSDSVTAYLNPIESNAKQQSGACGYAEAEIRSSITFQLNRLASVLFKQFSKHVGTQDDFDVVCEGQSVGELIYFGDLLLNYKAKANADARANAREVDSDNKRAHRTAKILCVREVDGNEDVTELLEDGIVGLVCQTTFPVLSHLGIRLRHARIPTIGGEIPLDGLFGQIVELNTRATQPVQITTKETTAMSPGPHFLPLLPVLTQHEVTFRLLPPDLITAEGCGRKAAVCARLSQTIGSGGLEGYKAPSCLALPHGSMDSAMRWQQNAEALAVLNGVRGIRATHQHVHALREAILGLKLDPMARKVLELGIMGEFEEEMSGSRSLNMMIRSSSNMEDLPDLPSAGLFESYPCVIRMDDSGHIDMDDVWLKIKSVWASLYSDAAVAARKSLGIPDQSASMAVLIQPMIRSEWSFIGHTCAPLTLVSRSRQHGPERQMTDRQSIDRASGERGAPLRGDSLSIDSGLKLNDYSNEMMYFELAKGHGETLARGGIQGGKPTRVLVPRNRQGQVKILSISSLLGQYNLKDDGTLQPTYVHLNQIETSVNFWSDVANRLKSLKRLEKILDCVPQDIEGCITNLANPIIWVVQARPQVIS